MACNEESRQRARIRQQSQLRLLGEAPLAAAWVRTGRAERAQVSWRYVTKRVLRDAMTCAAIKEEHARRTLPSESARSIRNQPTMRRCACPRGCAKAVHGDQQYCDYCFVESGFEQQPECGCEGCCGNRVIADYAKGASTTSSGSRSSSVGLFGGRGIHELLLWLGHARPSRECQKKNLWRAWDHQRTMARRAR